MKSELYDLAKEIIKINPWKYFESIDFIKIMLPDSKEPVYCNVVGHDIGVYSIEIYNGNNEFWGLANSYADDFPDHQMNRYISNIFCQFGSDLKLSKRQRRLKNYIRSGKFIKNITFVRNKVGYLKEKVDEKNFAFLFSCLLLIK